MNVEGFGKVVEGENINVERVGRMWKNLGRVRMDVERFGKDVEGENECGRMWWGFGRMWKGKHGHGRVW